MYIDTPNRYTIHFEEEDLDSIIRVANTMDEILAKMQNYHCDTFASEYGGRWNIDEVEKMTQMLNTLWEVFEESAQIYHD